MSEVEFLCELVSRTGCQLLCDVWLEIYGSRGQFHINRLAEAEFIFRKRISKGRTIGVAAACALDADPAFDAGQALAALIGAGLVTKICEGTYGENHDNR